MFFFRKPETHIDRGFQFFSGWGFCANPHHSLYCTGMRQWYTLTGMGPAEAIDTGHALANQHYDLVHSAHREQRYFL